MNAYELSKLMLDVTDCETSEYYQAGMMLKQQADRIAELEKIKNVSDIPFAMAILDDKLEIAMYGPYNSWFANEISHVPLYTHPHKELSDKEIFRLSEKCDMNHVLGIIDFGRAVIKASRGEE